LPRSSAALIAILTFWLVWSCDAHTHRGKRPDATSSFASGRQLSGIHLPDGCHQARSRHWPVTCLHSTLSLTYLDDLYNEESEDGEGESTEGYGLGVMPVIRGMTDDLGWQFALLLSPEAVASRWARAVLRC
jgi:hypothetical protein